ncbi:radical SAM protein [Geobacter sp. FeAm09]|uniref:radical SAM protein n=1 Tax=Geobacter sp. FeAm09 TaxID=2597769 RepID=UPI0011EDB991|nr:radical SAM protein [Geobacter sp. FeAm09]QEM66876.1 radical SAM protein [Geobacter sp. FeAm09]
MEACIIVTYRCNAKCHMCNTWQYPTKPAMEIGPDIIKKLPNTLDFINITGGEPFLRQDLAEIVAIALTKTKRLVISSNGYFTDRMVALAKQFPNIGIRISIEGLPATNDKLRGISEGFDRGLRSLLELKALGLKDIGFGITVSDINARDMIELYRLADAMDLEFATASTHNSYYFHKADNVFSDPEMVAQEFERLSRELLKTKRIKNWFRAYFNYGMANYVRGGKRLLPCEVGTDMFFVDPCGKVMPCNGTDTEMPMGDLTTQTFEEIWQSEQARKVRESVKACKKNCWMIGSVAPAMRKDKLTPLKWIIKQKLCRGRNDASK